MLTIQILTRDNEKTISKTLDSIKNIKSEIIVGDLGSKDKTLDICSGYGVEIINIKDKDLSRIRNQLSRDLNFYINPWEELVQGHEMIESIKDCCSVYVFQNNVISKEIRFWTKNDKFVNPIFETIINKKAKLYSDIILSSNNKPNNHDENLKIVKDWMNQRPVDIEPYYYLACCYLSINNYNKFIFYAKEYCNRENKINSSFIMMKYYIAQINLYFGNTNEAAKHVLTCLSYHPSSAEFWCLLGDIYYKQKSWDKSLCFYENAMILGSKRKNNDLPIEIIKYKEYPNKMIENIKTIKNKSELFAG